MGQIRYIHRYSSVGRIAVATRSGATARAVPAKKANILTRESAVFLFPFSNGHRRTAFRFHYGRRAFFILKSRRAPRAFYFPPFLFFFHDPVSVFYARGPQTMPSWPLN